MILRIQRDPLPVDVEYAFYARGNIRETNFNEYIKLLAKKGIELRLIDYGDADAGYIQKTVEVIKRSIEVKQVPKYRIRLNEIHDPNVQFATLIHELAHLYLGHLGPDRYLKIKDRSYKKLSEQELEAESVSYLNSLRGHYGCWKTFYYYR